MPTANLIRNRPATAARATWRMACKTLTVASIASIAGLIGMPRAFADTTRTLPLQSPTQLDLKSGEELVIRGAVVNSKDNSIFDASTRSELAGGQRVARPGGLIELEGTGLALVSQNPTTHEVRLVATGAAAPLCAALGAPGPCIVPRLKAIAHEQLVTESELRAQLSGDLQVTLPEIAMSTVASDVAAPIVRPLGRIALASGIIILIAVAILAFVRHRSSPAQAFARQAARTRTALGRHRDYVAMVPHVQALEGKAHAIYKQLRLVGSRLGDPSLAGDAAQLTLREEHARLQKTAVDLTETLALLETKALVAEPASNAGADADLRRARDELALLEQANVEAEAVLRR
jgi:hypothetical protein